MDKTAKTKAVGKHKARTVKYPTKTSINMMTCGLPQHTGRTLGIGVCLIALLVAFVVKVGVYDQLARLDRAESAYQTVKSDAAGARCRLRGGAAGIPGACNEFRLRRCRGCGGDR